MQYEEKLTAVIACLRHSEIVSCIVSHACIMCAIEKLIIMILNKVSIFDNPWPINLTLCIFLLKPYHMVCENVCIVELSI